MNEVVDIDHGWKEILQRVAELAAGPTTKVGILGNSARGGLHQKGADGKASKLTVAEIAVVNEFGTEDGHIPSRSFFRSTFDEMRSELESDTARLIVKVVIERTMTTTQALNVLGMKLAMAVRRKITETPLSGVGPENAPITKVVKALKGKGKRAFRVRGDIADVGVTAYTESLGWAGPQRRAVGAARSLGQAFAQIGALASVRTLVDTGTMVRAISWAIVERGQQAKERYLGGR